ncbi:Protein kinase family protein [Quillaja saponaria]|uniref:non-specific serine/threonine protein kinase n=1 Tax=Quillaja saponaria TaxID=32244 RepID=A0AAD7L9U8_QUISA|nr:Protein kinase family protein [Quillaja saponaria]
MMAPISFYFFLILSHLVLLLSAEGEKGYVRNCPSSFYCGNLGYRQFPFTSSSRPDCGILVIYDCENPNSSVDKQIELEKKGSRFKIEEANPDANSVSIHDNVLQEELNSSYCEAIKYNFTLPRNTPILSFYFPNIVKVFRCNRSFNINAPGPEYFKSTSCQDYDIYCPRQPEWMNPLPEMPSYFKRCSSYDLPFTSPPTPQDQKISLSPVLTVELKLSDECRDCYHNRGGQCRLNNKGIFYCAKDNNTALKLGLGLGLGFGLPIIVMLIFWRYKRTHPSSDIQSRNTYHPYSNSDLETGSVIFGVPVFSYTELEEATNNFDHNKELGDGGFGTVYHGKLRDGREVAVKRLYEHNYRQVERFMNEIEILTRLRHQNLVSLYGCTSRHCRELLLVYEYIPNGTVADHVHGNHAKPGSPPWSIRIKIAIDTASALAYLHSSDIIHRDVKTNNILLDNNYCVKVADFGLSRLFPIDVTHVSTAPQGTPGYVDPEYHQCYQLTSKSDVYSFGVVLIELISSMPAVDITRHRHEINLANLAITKIQKCAFNELVDPTLGFESDNEIKRMTISVGELAFQCLQQEKEMRPSMAEILEALKRIECGKKDPENLEEKDIQDGGMSNSVQPPPPPSPEEYEVAAFTNHCD